MQLAADRPHQLGEVALDRHMDVFVAATNTNCPASSSLAPIEAAQQRIAIFAGDDLPRGEHLRVRARLSDVLRPQAPIEADRRVHPDEVGVLGLVEAGHGEPQSYELPHVAYDPTLDYTPTWPTHPA